MQSQSPSAKKATLHVIAQSHIDLAWLWQWEPETTHVCCKLTFGQAVENLQSNPDYYFSQSQVPLYEATEKYHPEIFAQIQKFIAEGRWEIVGGMYVEAEGAEPSGESLVRQCIHGKRYFKEKFGIDVQTGWQEDSWSHPWQLPQIYAQCGITSYFWKRGKKSPQMFWWHSPDGSRILAIKPPHLLAGTHRMWDQFVLRQWIRKNLNTYHSNDIMVRIGKGDHGGGPKQKEIDAVHQYARSHQNNLFVQFDSFQNFAQAIMKQDVHLPIVNYEIGNELQGDLTNCVELKHQNRVLETLLLSAEKWNTIASLFKLSSPATKNLYDAWNLLLFNQFHDIIGGSGLPAVCTDALRDYKNAEKITSEILKTDLNSLLTQITTVSINPDAIPLVLFNSLGWERTEIITTIVKYTKNPANLVILDTNGKSNPVQILNSKYNQNTWEVEILFEAILPAFGYCVVYLSETSSIDVFSDLIVSPTTLENNYYQISLDSSTGNIIRIFDKQNHRDVITAQNQANHLIAIDDLGDSEGKFDIKKDYAPKPLGSIHEIPLSVSEPQHPAIEILERGPLRIGIRIHKYYLKSKFTQDIYLVRNSRRIDFHLNIDWHDLHTMVKLLFPIALQSPEITYHMPYGTILRKGDGIEYPVLEWVDLSLKDYGVALINNTRNGCSVDHNILGLSILRSPTKPANNNEEGIHHLDYAIFPHIGTWKDAWLMHISNSFNTPTLIHQTTPHNGKWVPTQSFFQLTPRNVIFEVIKFAYDSDEVILRLYEIEGKMTKFKLIVPFEVDVISKVNLLEQKILTQKINNTVVEWEIHAYEILSFAIHIAKLPLSSE